MQRMKMMTGMTTMYELIINQVDHFQIRTISSAALGLLQRVACQVQTFVDSAGAADEPVVAPQQPQEGLVKQTIQCLAALLEA